MNQQRIFAELDGQEIIATTLANQNGCTLEILNYGAIVYSLKVPDRNGAFRDVVLGHDLMENYKNDGANHGALIGRYGNRIGKGKITVGATSYQLALNDNGINHLHGGMCGYSKRIWNIEEVSKNRIVLSLEDKDGTENYPGTVLVTVCYTLTEENALKIEYFAKTDADTYFNPTNHTYFNLSGYDSATQITDHVLKIDAQYYTPTGKDLIPTGELRKVDGTPFDFRTPKAIAKDLEAEDEDLHNGNGYDHNFVLGEPKSYKENVCEVYDEKSGIVMKVSTDMPAVQLYIGNFLDGSFKGKGGIPIRKRTGFCLETQYSPDTPNKPSFPSCLLRQGESFSSVTTYAFSVK